MARRLRVLIVEDETMIAEFLADVLADIGHEVVAVTETEDEAVAAAARTRPDLMLVDAALIDGSGIAAIHRILVDAYVPHIVMSGDRATLAAARPAVTLAKPFTERDLADAIGRAIPTIAATG